VQGPFNGGGICRLSKTLTRRSKSLGLATGEVKARPVKAAVRKTMENCMLKVCDLFCLGLMFKEL